MNLRPSLRCGVKWGSDGVLSPRGEGTCSPINVWELERLETAVAEPQTLRAQLASVNQWGLFTCSKLTRLAVPRPLLGVDSDLPDHTPASAAPAEQSWGSLGFQALSVMLTFEFAWESKWHHECQKCHTIPGTQ